MSRSSAHVAKTGSVIARLRLRSIHDREVRSTARPKQDATSLLIPLMNLSILPKFFEGGSREFDQAKRRCDLKNYLGRHAGHVGRGAGEESSRF